MADSFHSVGLLPCRSPAEEPGEKGAGGSVPGGWENAAGWFEGGSAILDASGRVIEIAESFAAWLGQPLAALRGVVLWDRLREYCSDWQEPLAALRATKAPFGEVNLRHALPDSPIPRWYRLERAAHAAGGFVRMSSILPPLADLQESPWDEYLRDGSAQRELFIRLLRAEAQLAALTEHWPGVIFSQRADFTFRFVSRKIEALTGVAVAEWQDTPLFWQVVHEADAEGFRAQLRQARESRQAATFTFRIRHRKSGRIAYVLEHRQPIVSRGGLLLGYEGVWLDVTRQTIAENRLCSAAWKETLSVLTMGLAHDFGNVMAGIHALSESFLEQAAANPELSEGLGLIRGNAHQASQLVRRIISLHQGQTGASHYHDLNEVATDLADLVRKILPRRIEFLVELSKEALAVYVDAVELRQIALGLVLNALEAMPESGRLVLRTSGHAALPPLKRWEGAAPRLPAACLSVQDNGSGVPERHLANLFDPFFTTKPNQGSGLGLYNARQFAERHHGGLSVETREGAGSTFHLWLPQADFTEAEAAPSRRALRPDRAV